MNPSAALSQLSDDVGSLWMPPGHNQSHNNSSIPILPHPPDSFTFLRDYVSVSRPCIIRNVISSPSTSSPSSTSVNGESTKTTRTSLRLNLDDIVTLFNNKNDGKSKSNGGQGGDETMITVNVTPDGYGDCIRPVVVVGDDDDHNGDTDRGVTKKMFVMPEERKMTLWEFREGLRRGRRNEMGGRDDILRVNGVESLKAFVSVDSKNSDSGGSDNSDNHHDDEGANISSEQVFYYSLQNDCLRTELPSLVSLGIVPPTISFAERSFNTGPPDAINLWIGDERSVSSMHKDHYENLFYVCSGEKVFTLCPPSDVVFLTEGTFDAGRFRWNGDNWVVVPYYDDYDDEDGGGEVELGTTTMRPRPTTTRWITSDVQRILDGDNAEVMEDYPTLKYAHPIEVKVSEGEMLYLPSLWFHRVTQTCETVGINYWYDMNFDAKWCYFNFLHALATQSGRPD